MTVGEFQVLLAEIGRFLRTFKAMGPAKEVEELEARLAGFKDYKLKPFGDLLVKAEEYARLGPQVKPPKAPKKAKADPAAIEQACARVAQLHDQAINPTTTLEAIETAVQELRALDPPAAKVNELLKRVGILKKPKGKDAGIMAVRQKIMSVKGTWDRKDS